MEVLVIGSRIPYPLHDGGAIATYNLLKGLASEGVNITFFSINTQKHFAGPELIASEFSFLRAVHTQTIDTGISPMAALINIFSSKSYNIERFYNKSFEQKLIDLVKTKRFDVIHFEGLYVAAYAPPIKKVSNVPMILRQHNIEYNIWKTLADQSRFLPKKMYLQLLAARMEKFEKNIFQFFDSIITITGHDELVIKNAGYRGLLQTIPAGIEVPDKENIHHINPNSIYHIGSMEWMPNRQAMDWFHNEVWPIIHRLKHDAEFYMAGKNTPEKYLEWNDQHFHVLGEVESQHEFAASKSILVVPLKSGSGIRIKTIEAMLAGKAVVTTSQGALGLPLVHNVHCLVADTKEDFAEAVLSLVNDQSLRNRLAENGRRLALENYGNEAVSRRWMEFYHKILEIRQHPPAPPSKGGIDFGCEEVGRKWKAFYHRLVR